MTTILGRSWSAALFWLSVLAFLVYSGIRLVHGETRSGMADLAVPVLIYGLAHALRAVRLGVLMGAGRARRLLGLYFYTAACSAVIPFKLGELVRINEIAYWCGSYLRGLLIVWMERVFDVIALGVIAAFFLSTSDQQPRDLSLLLWVVGGFVFLTFLLFFIAPEQLSGLNLHVIRSYKGRKAVRILRTLESLHQFFEQVRPLMAGKVVTLSLLTFFIWGAELLAVSMLFQSEVWQSAVTSLVRQFAQVLGGDVHATGITAEFEDMKMLALIAAGFVALAFYGRLRVQANK